MTGNYSRGRSSTAIKGNAGVRVPAEEESTLIPGGVVARHIAVAAANVVLQVAGGAESRRSCEEMNVAKLLRVSRQLRAFLLSAARSVPALRSRRSAGAPETWCRQGQR